MGLPLHSRTSRSAAHTLAEMVEMTEASWRSLARARRVDVCDFDDAHAD